MRWWIVRFWINLTNQSNTFNWVGICLTSSWLFLLYFWFWLNFCCWFLLWFWISVWTIVSRLNFSWWIWNRTSWTIWWLYRIWCLSRLIRIASRSTWLNNRFYWLIWFRVLLLFGRLLNSWSSDRFHSTSK